MKEKHVILLIQQPKKFFLQKWQRKPKKHVGGVNRTTHIFLTKFEKKTYFDVIFHGRLLNNSPQLNFSNVFFISTRDTDEKMILSAFFQTNWVKCHFLTFFIMLFSKSHECQHCIIFVLQNIALVLFTPPYPTIKSVSTHTS